MRYRTIKISKAKAAPDIKKTDKGYELVENSEYKYLTAMPVCEDRGFMPLCSKDGEHWHVCFGAYDLEGEPINVQLFAMAAENKVDQGVQA